MFCFIENVEVDFKSDRYGIVTYCYILRLQPAVSILNLGLFIDNNKLDNT